MMNEEDKKIEDWLGRLQMQRDIDVDKNWKQLHGRIHREETRRRWLHIAYRAAAILLLPALILSGYLYHRVDCSCPPSFFPVIYITGSINWNPCLSNKSN